jgi:hypothetical protein
VYTCAREQEVCGSCRHCLMLKLSISLMTTTRGEIRESRVSSREVNASSKEDVASESR